MVCELFQNLVKNYDQDMEMLTKQQKQQVEKAETNQQLEMKAAGKRLKIEQVGSLHHKYPVSMHLVQYSQISCFNASGSIFTIYK